MKPPVARDVAGIHGGGGAGGALQLRQGSVQEGEVLVGHALDRPAGDRRLDKAAQVVHVFHFAQRDLGCHRSYVGFRLYEPLGLEHADALPDRDVGDVEAPLQIAHVDALSGADCPIQDQSPHLVRDGIGHRSRALRQLLAADDAHDATPRPIRPRGREHCRVIVLLLLFDARSTCLRRPARPRPRGRRQRSRGPRRAWPRAVAARR